MGESKVLLDFSAVKCNPEAPNVIAKVLKITTSDVIYS